VLVWWRSAAWHPRGLPAPPKKQISVETWQKYEQPMPRRLAMYLVVNYAIIVVGVTLLLFFHARLPMWFVAGGGGAVLLALLAFGALMERKRWAVPVEVLRLSGSAGLLAAVLTW
jgi:hypothetical protein